MKKIVALLVALGAAGMLSAQVTFGIGARGQFGLSLGTTLSNSDGDLSFQPLKSFMAGGALVGRIGFDSVPGLFLQPEIGFTHSQAGWKASDTETNNSLGIEFKVETETTSTVGYNSIDIPIIIGYDVEVGSGMVVSPFAGFNLSIPVGSINSSYDYDVTVSINGKDVTSEYKNLFKGSSGSFSGDIQTTVIPGVLLGVGFGYKFDDHNMLMGDLRYLLDFTAIQYKDVDSDIMTRRGLTLGVSYVYFF